MAITKKNIEATIKLAKKYGAKRLLLFGSALYDPDNANDLDLGVQGIEGMKFFEFGAILETIINAQVDIVDLNDNNRFVNYITAHGKVIYDNAG